jgi:hypothetical protein
MEILLQCCGFIRRYAKNLAKEQRYALPTTANIKLVTDMDVLE